MAFDTIGIESPEITDEIADLIETTSIIRRAVDQGTGEVLYHITNKKLAGSYDASISVQVMRYRYVRNDYEVDGERKIGKPIQLFCAPYLRIEFSAHKFQQGHNVVNGPLNVLIPCYQCMAVICQHIGISIHALPDLKYWRVYRVDFACVYPIGRPAVMSYFATLDSAKMSFGYRKMQCYKEKGIISGFFMAGDRITFRLYHKGQEFRAHDKKRLRKIMQDHDIEMLERLADDILRCEIQLNRKQLKDDFGGNLPLISQVTLDYLTLHYDHFIKRLLADAKFAKDDFKSPLRNEVSVQHYLYQNFSKQKAKSLYAFFVSLVQNGEKMTKAMSSKSTYYRDVKILLEHNISWFIENDYIDGDYQCYFPSDFIPLSTSHYRVTDFKIEDYDKLYKTKQSEQ